MKTINEFPENVLDLLMQKQFSQLTKPEKKLVEAFLDEVQYAGLRETHNAINSAEKNITAPLSVRPQTHDVLLNALRNKKKAPAERQNIFGYKIPLWQAAAAVFILFSSFLLVKNNGKNNVVGEQIATVTDTIKVVKQEIQNVLVYDTVYFKEKPQKSRQKAKRTIIMVEGSDVYQNELATLQPRNLSVLSLDESKNLQQTGSSLSDDSLVNRFNFVTIN